MLLNVPYYKTCLSWGQWCFSAGGYLTSICNSLHLVPITTKQSTNISHGFSSRAQVKSAHFCDSFNAVFLHDFCLCMFRHTYILKLNKRSFLLSTNKIAPNFLTPCILSQGDRLPPSIVDTFFSHLDPPPPYLHLAARYTHAGTELRWAVGSQQHQDYRKLGGECIFPQHCPIPDSVVSMQQWGLMKCSWCPSRERCILHMVGVSPFARFYNSHQC